MKIWILVFFVPLVGCYNPQHAKPVPQAVHVDQPSSAENLGVRREGDPRFSEKERRIVNAAKRYLESEPSRKIDAFYKVTLDGDNYAVYVQFVENYQDGVPQFVAGGFCVVWLTKDETVIQVGYGA